MEHMRAFDVQVNGRKLCLAGVGTDGAFAAIIDHVIRGGRNQIHIRVGGLRGVQDGPDEHVEWASRNLRTGDEITFGIVETDSVDRPKNRERVIPGERRRNDEKLRRTLAKKLGWKVVARPKRRSN